MRAFLVRRLLWMLPTFLGITLVVFAIVRAAPGDPLSAQGDFSLGADASSARAILEYRRLMGLDDPALVGWAKWASHVVQGDLGTSFKDGRPVLTKIAEALPVTLGLALVSLLVTFLVAVPVGVWSAIRPGAASDRGLTLGLFVLYSMPAPWVAMLLIAVASSTRWLPIQGLHEAGVSGFADLAKHAVLPLFCLTYASFASLSRYVRSGVLEVIRQDFVRTARAKGLGERAVIVRHVLRNALLGLITLAGLMLPGLLGGAVIIERIFGLPGMGRLSFEAILSKDLPVLMGTTSLAAVVTMGALLATDVAYALVDPRISVEDR